ncbi:hypothetical protein EXIGLDRAFT_772808 [Exidia glandulosa HHB12029]|uniref:SGNH hydrolase n=1 Tax=Exidia glandulosa HHB12029 TaxID=1314781 RepID=A0A165F4A3_EXIGL|nr:hypothetical protein EXIGLDRAFT_772808 [Exidia glandulosa HHB12029]
MHASAELVCALAAGTAFLLWHEIFISPHLWDWPWSDARLPAAYVQDQPRSFSFVTRPEHLFIFGDSYCTCILPRLSRGADGPTASEGWPWPEGTSPLEDYEMHTASDGPVWARNLTTSYEKPVKLVNLACGGATVDNDILQNWNAPPDFKNQVSTFLQYVTPPPKRIAWHSYNSIFAIEFGTNDVLICLHGTERMRRTKQTEDDVYKELMWHYFDSVERLYNAGARAFAFHVLVPFDRARIGVDAGALTQAQLKQSIMRYNAALRSAAQTYCDYKRQQTDGDIFCSIIDIYSLGHDIMNQPHYYGFKEAIDYCPPYSWRSNAEPDMDVDPSCIGPVGDYVWKDALHPSWTFHQWWARQFQNQMLEEAPKDDE